MTSSADRLLFSAALWGRGDRWDRHQTRWDPEIRCIMPLTLPPPRVRWDQVVARLAMPFPFCSYQTVSSVPPSRGSFPSENKAAFFCREPFPSSISVWQGQSNHSQN